MQQEVPALGCSIPILNLRLADAESQALQVPLCSNIHCSLFVAPLPTRRGRKIVSQLWDPGAAWRKLRKPLYCPIQLSKAVPGLSKNLQMIIPTFTTQLSQDDYPNIYRSLLFPPALHSGKAEPSASLQYDGEHQGLRWFFSLRSMLA